MKDYTATYVNEKTGESKELTIRDYNVQQALMAGLAKRNTTMQGWTLMHIEPKQAKKEER